MPIIEIQSDPLPRKKSVQKSKSSELVAAMNRLEVGQCFYVTFDKGTYNIISTQCSYIKSKTQKTFTMRKLSKDAEYII